MHTHTELRSVAQLMLLEPYFSFSDRFLRRRTYFPPSAHFDEHTVAQEHKASEHTACASCLVDVDEVGDE